MNLLAFINWDFKPEILEDPIKIVYYGPCWALSFIIGLYLITKMMKRDNAPDYFSDKILMYMMVGGIVGARLGHVFFYDWAEYKDNLIDIFKIWEGGLASHGGAIGILIANWLYARNVTKRTPTWSLDKIVVTVALAASLIRVGNLTNSEIIGTKSESSSAFFFEYAAKQRATRYMNWAAEGQIAINEMEIASTKDYVTEDNFNYPKGILTTSFTLNKPLTEQYVASLASHIENNLKEQYDYENHHIIGVTDEAPFNISVNGNNATFSIPVLIVPRIPTQIWEAAAYLVVFIFLFFAYWKLEFYKRDGLLFGLFMILMFSARFVIEFWKEKQAAAIDEEDLINMGQWLSIPGVLIGLYYVYRAFKNPAIDTTIQIEELNKNNK